MRGTNSKIQWDFADIYMYHKVILPLNTAVGINSTVFMLTILALLSTMRAIVADVSEIPTYRLITYSWQSFSIVLADHRGFIFSNFK